MAEKIVWPKLKNAPIIMAIFQIKFESENIDIRDYLKFDSKIRKSFPNRNDKMQTQLQIPGTVALGISKISSTLNTQLDSYVYFSQDQKKKLLLERDSIAFTDENKYIDWEIFQKNIFDNLLVFDFLKNSRITRLSIRFINQFLFDEFNEPTKYINLGISSTEEAMKYPVIKYGFNYRQVIPETNISAIINHNLEPSTDNKYAYIFDIDILDMSNLIYDVEIIKDTLSNLREIKNQIFFTSLTNNTIELCS